MKLPSPLAAEIFPTASWECLKRRALLLRQLRNFFYQRHFVEVETPLLSADTVVDRHIDPIAVVMQHGAGESACAATMWLQTSPEFGMKRLLAAGGEALFQVTKAFRSAEQGALHNIEFTIVEWYRVGDTMSDGIRLLNELSCELLGRGSAEQLSYREAFQRHAGIDPHAADDLQLQRFAEQRCHASASSRDSYDRDGLLNLLLVDCVQPHLGQDRPAILYDYPASQAALAQVRNDDPPVAERFELYVAGIELANGYHELLDAQELRQRIGDTNRQRVAAGKQPLPENSRLLTAMQHGLPPCTGVALGFDRLVMMATGASMISDVIAFPFDRA